MTTHTQSRLTIQQTLVSTDINDFSQAQEFQANCIDSEQYGYPFIISINSSVFSSNQQYFMSTTQRREPSNVRTPRK